VPRLGPLAAVALVSMLVSGCHRETPIERGAREYHERQQGRIASAELETIHFRGLSDAQMVAVNHKDGLGLGLRLQQLDRHLGEPLKLHLAYENTAAQGPISATTCQGFSLGTEDMATGQSTAAPVTFNCNKEDPLRDNNLHLPQGELKTANIIEQAADLNITHPGQYLLVAGWQTFSPHNRLFLRGDEYSTLPSNQVVVTVH
jgi:hypothetical protein